MDKPGPVNPYLDTPASPRPRIRVAGDATFGKRVLFGLGLFLFSSAVGLALVRVRAAIVFAGLFGVFSVGTILRRPWWGLLIYTAVFMIRPGELFPALARLRLEMIVGSVTLAGLAYQQYLRDGRLALDRSWQTRFLCLFVVAAFFSVPTSYWRSVSVDGVMTLLKILAFYIMVVHLVDTRVRLKVFIWTLLVLTIGVIASSFEGTVYVKQGIERVYGITSAVGGPNALGATVAATFPLLLLLGLHKPLRGLRPLLLASCVMLVYVLSITGSRAGVLGFLGGLACLWWMSPRRVATGLVGVIVLVVAFTFLPNQYKQRYSTITSSTLDASSLGRIETWKDGMHMVADRPLLGVGINAFQTAHYVRDGWGLDAHSMYIQVLAEVGLIGAVPFFCFLVQMLILNRRTARILESEPDWTFERVVLHGVFAGLVALLIGATFGTQYIKRLWYIYAAVQLVTLRCYVDEQQLGELHELPKPQSSGKRRCESRASKVT